MSKSYLAEAFEELELVDDNKLTGTFDFDKKGAEDLKKFMEDDTFNDFETVIDPEAETEEDLQDSYIGMGILGCDICHSMIYKPIEDIVIDEETQMANVGECCPYCYERDGFKIIGKVAPFEDISVEVEKTEDGEEVPEPTVKVNGKDVPIEEAPAKEEEALTAEQKYPVQSPISEDMNTKVPSKRKIGAAMESVATELEEALSNSEKLFRAFPELREPIKESINDNKIIFKYISDSDNEEYTFIIKYTNNGHWTFKEKGNAGYMEFDTVDDLKNHLDDLKEDSHQFNLTSILDKIQIILDKSIKESINEGMEDISITTDDQVIKVKATPREDKETIVPVEPKEIEQPVEEKEPEVEETPVDGEDELMDIELDEIDETSFDELGESYLKKVYDNVNSFKTVNGSLDANNRLVLEGVIEFKSGKKAKTNFIFEAKEVTRKGKIKFIGENVNLSKNKRAFTLTGSTKNKNLICEQFNYNYLAKDEKSGASKRLYGTIRK